MNTPREEFDQFVKAEAARTDLPPAPRTPEPPAPTPIRQPVMTFPRVIPPVDTIMLGDELHVIKPLMLLPLDDQISATNDRNAQLSLSERKVALKANGEDLTDEEQLLDEFYLRRIIKLAVPTCPEWVFLPGGEGGFLPEQYEALVTFFFERSRELRALLGRSVNRPILPAPSPDSSVSTAATPEPGSDSPDSGSTLTPPRSDHSKPPSS